MLLGLHFATVFIIGFGVGTASHIIDKTARRLFMYGFAVIGLLFALFLYFTYGVLA